MNVIGVVGVMHDIGKNRPIRLLVNVSRLNRYLVRRKLMKRSNRCQFNNVKGERRISVEFDAVLLCHQLNCHTLNRRIESRYMIYAV